MSKLTGRTKPYKVYKTQRTYKGYGGAGKDRSVQTIAIAKDGSSIIIKHKK